MDPSEETVRDRRNRWADMPESHTRYHAGQESRAVLQGETQPRYSFFGQGLLLLMQEHPENEWHGPHRSGAMLWWTVDDTNEILSEFYHMDIEDLGRIHELQKLTVTRREELAQIVRDTPLVS